MDVTIEELPPKLDQGGGFVWMMARNNFVCYDYQKILGIDSEIDISLGNAVTQIKNQENLWSKFSSDWSKGKAKELLESIVAKAVKSEKLERDFVDPFDSPKLAEGGIALIVVSSD